MPQNTALHQFILSFIPSKLIRAFSASWRVGGFCTALRSGFLSAEKADKRTGFFRKRKKPYASRLTQG
jgi:hypothetical protein